MVVILLAVADPIGNVPYFISALRAVPRSRRPRVIARECLIAYALLLLFGFFGDSIMKVFGVSDRSLHLAGGVVMFLIAMRMIFPVQEKDEAPQEEPFIVPLAVPAVAGPGAIATLIILVSRSPGRTLEWVAAVTIAVGVVALTVVFAERLSSVLGERTLIAIERLMGLVFSAIAVEMLLRGIEIFVRQM
jgi:MarC family membrane protein